MTISHRATDASVTSTESSKRVKVARMACCCKLSDLLPLVQQLHQETAQQRAARRASRSEAA